MSYQYQLLEKQFIQLSQLEHALTFLQWDQLVMMPPGGNKARSEAIAELCAIHHGLLVKPEMGELLAEAEATEKDSEVKLSLAEMQREYNLAACLPSDLVKAKSLAGSKCEHGWRTQRQENDWPGFLENFREVVKLSREEAQARQAVDPESFTTPYDALLDLYCTGDSSRMISDIFTVLKNELPQLISEVREKQKMRSNQFEALCSIEAQKKLNRELSTCLGFDFNRGRIDESSHPFSTGALGDHRITSRYRNDNFIDALKSTAHETGHAAYENGLPIRWDGLPLGQARNLSIHESQSLLFEKQIFLSKAFISFFTPTIHTFLPEVRKFSHGQIWQSSTRVRPQLIRVEADELCYPLHVILRYEIEYALINGNLETDDLPEAWSEKTQTYLGLSTDGNFKDGCLQDIHWTDGSFGYFPAYTLGSLNGVQMFAALCREHGDWQEQFARGEIQFVRNWLDDKIWSKGRMLESQQLLVSATGEGTNPEHFLSYIKDRYLNELY